jgi:dTDP-4-dehydrorhamnose 3,5-epimerase-like enzyme
MSEPTAVGAGCSLIRLVRHADERGLLAVLDEGAGLPFRPARLFVVTDVPPAIVRGQHAHARLHEVLIAVSGSVAIEVDDGTERAVVVLDDPAVGLHVPPRVWAAQRDFSPGAVLVVLASHPYDPDDYITDRHALLTGVDD